jgi:catechol-2,3-dioxygenase
VLGIVPKKEQIQKKQKRIPPATQNMLDFDNPSDKVLSPTVLAHVVLRTANLQGMTDFYTTFLGGTVTHSNEMIATASP